ncbi:MAG: hypothetical protein ACLFUZ_01055 [Candidatus Micrarchaeia archaeon]
MGLLDWVLGKGKKKKTAKEAPAGGSVPFKISHKFSPLRLKAHQDSKVDMTVKVVNVSGSKQLVSSDVILPKGKKVGFDVTYMNKHHEERLGELEDGESKSFTITIHGGPVTARGEVPVKITAYAHYLNYRKVLEETSKTAKLRII